MKKLLPLLIAALMVIPTAMTAQTAKTRQWKGAPYKLSTTTQMGDVNGDGTITITDVALMVGYILGDQNSDFIAANADINNDNSITITDITETVAIILEGIQEIPPLILSDSELFFTNYFQDAIEIISGSGNYTITSSDSTVATAMIVNTSIIVTFKGNGQAVITVRDTISKQTAFIFVRFGPQFPDWIHAYLTCPDDNHPHIIDLGLPSGTLWACCNVGTIDPEGYGGHYAWGETNKKAAYNEVTYKYCWGVDLDNDGWYDDIDRDGCSDAEYQNIGIRIFEDDDWYDIAGTQYDVATVKWGDSWQMPTGDQLYELMMFCDYPWETLNGVNGLKFIGPNGGSIFLPAAGTRIDDEFIEPGEIGRYWSSTTYFNFADNIQFNMDDLSYLCCFNVHGNSVRPIWNGNAPITIQK